MKPLLKLMISLLIGITICLLIAFQPNWLAYFIAFLLFSAIAWIVLTII